jgi:tripartite-type tricarboxylate transporter receptor subunit TctC
LLGGQTDLMFASLSSSIPLIKAGRLRAFAVTGAKRSPSIPELPTVAEAAGLKGYEASAWFGIVGPAGMPKTAVAVLSKAALSTLDDAEVRKRLFNAGVEIRTSTPDEFAHYIESEMQKWAKVVKASGARAD